MLCNRLDSVKGVYNFSLTCRQFGVILKEAVSRGKWFKIGVVWFKEVWGSSGQCPCL